MFTNKMWGTSIIKLLKDFKVFILVLFLLSLIEVVRLKTCRDSSQCGLGGGCVLDGSVGECDCSFTDTMFKEDDSGNCSDIVLHCSVENVCRNNGICIDIFTSYFCSCERGCYGKDCSTCFTFKEGDRVDRPFMVYKVRDSIFAKRHVMVCHQTIPNNFSSYLTVQIPGLGRMTRIIYKNNFMVYGNAYDTCQSYNIPNDLCALLPADKMDCVIHVVSLPYDFPMHEQYATEDAFYNIYYDGGSTRTINSFVEDFELRGKLTFFSDWEDKKYICAPKVFVENTGTTFTSMTQFPLGSLVVLRLNTTKNPHCHKHYTFGFHVWNIYRVANSWSDILVPVLKKVETNSVALGGFSAQIGMYKVEVWVTYRMVADNIPVTFKNFGFGYFYIDRLPAQPVIKGGSVRWVSPGEGLVVDGSDSYDAGILKWDENDFIYTWNCNLTTIGCAWITHAGAVTTLNISLIPGSIVNIGLRIKYAKKPARIIFQTEQDVVVAHHKVPEVFIKCIVNCGGSSMKTDPAEPLYLLASKIDYTGKEVWKWRLNDEINGVDLDIDSYREPNHHPFECIVAGGKLKESYVYGFIVEDGSYPSGRAEFYVIVQDSMTTKDKEKQPSFSVKHIGNKYHEIKVSGFHQLGSFANQYEFYHKGEDEDDIDTMFAYNAAGFVANAILITNNIYVRCCNILGYCVKLESNVKITRPTIAVIENHRRFVETAHTDVGCLNDILMKGIAVCHFINLVPIKDKTKLLDTWITILTKMTHPFDFRDCHQYLTIFTKFLKKRQFLSDGNGINIKFLISITKYLNSLSITFRNVIKTNYPMQPDHSTADHIAIIDLFLTNLDIILENRKLVMSDPKFKNDAFVLLKCKKISGVVTNILDNLAIFLARKLAPGMHPILRKTKNILFWLQKDELPRIADLFIPEVFSTFRNASVRFPAKLAKSLTKPLIHHIINVVVFDIDPFWWNPTSNQATTSVIYTTLNKIVPKKFAYEIENVVKVDRNFQLFFERNTIDVEVNGNVTFPLNESSNAEKDLSLDVYRLKTGARYRMRFFDLKGHELRVKEFPYRPDYGMIDDFDVVNESYPTYHINTQGREETFFYIAIFPGLKEIIGVTIPYKFNISRIECLVWSDVDGWIPGHSLVDPSQFEKEAIELLTCRCNHFSGFAASVEISKPLKAKLYSYNLSLPKIHSFTILLYLLLLLLLLLFCFILAYIQDKKDDLAAKVIILEDNEPSDTYPYLIGVYTGNRISSGTSATIGLQFFGDSGTSRVHILKCTYRNVLQRGSDDWFIMFTKSSLGYIENVYIWSDFTGLNPSWFCYKIVVVDLIDEDEYVFIVDEWLTIYLEQDAVLTHEVEAAEPPVLYSPSFITVYNTYITLRESHIWSGLLFRHPRSCLRRTQRVGIIIFQIFSYHLIFLWLIGGLTFRLLLDSQYSTLFWPKTVGKFILTYFLIEPFKFAFSYCFKKSVSCDYYPKESYDSVSKSKYRYIVTNRTEKLYTYPNRTQKLVQYILQQPLQPVIVTVDDNFRRNPRYRRWRVCAWFLLVFIVAVEFIILCFFGFRIPERRGFSWIIGVCIIIILGVFFFEPIMLTLTSFILGYVFKVSQLSSTLLIHNVSALIKYNNSRNGEEIFERKLKLIRSQQCYEPLPMKKERIVRKVLYINWYKKWTIFDLIVVIIYLLSFFAMLSQLTINQNYHTVQFIKKLFNESTLNSPGIYGVSKLPELWLFLESNFLNKLFVSKWYNGDPLANSSTDEFITSMEGFNHILVGVPKIRQQRVKPATCSVPAELERITKHCSSYLTGANEDKSNYKNSWNNSAYLDDFDNSKQDIWKYKKPSETDSVQSFGASGTLYNAGGYVAELHSTDLLSRFTLDFLQERKWLDNLTRVIFIEFSLYNVNERVFTWVEIIGENYASDTYTMTIRIHSLVHEMKFGIHNKITVCVFMVFTVIWIMVFRSTYLFQLNGVKRFFTKLPTLLYFSSVFTGLFAMLFSLTYFVIDVFNAHHEEIDLDFFRIGRHLIRERCAMGMWALFTAFSVVRLMFVWFLSNRTTCLIPVLYYTLSCVVIIVIVSVVSTVIFSKYVSNLIQSPTYFSLLLPFGFNFRQVVGSSFFPNKVLIPLYVCVTSCAIFVVVRVLIMYFFAIAQFNQTKNLFHIIGKRSLASVVFDHKFRRFDRFRGGSDNPKSTILRNFGYYLRNNYLKNWTVKSDQSCLKESKVKSLTALYN